MVGWIRRRGCSARTASADRRAASRWPRSARERRLAAWRPCARNRYAGVAADGAALRSDPARRLAGGRRRASQRSRRASPPCCRAPASSGAISRSTACNAGGDSDAHRFSKVSRTRSSVGSGSIERGDGVVERGRGRIVSQCIDLRQMLLEKHGERGCEVFVPDLREGWQLVGRLPVLQQRVAVIGHVDRPFGLSSSRSEHDMTTRGCEQGRRRQALQCAWIA